MIHFNESLLKVKLQIGQRIEASQIPSRQEINHRGLKTNRGKFEHLVRVAEKNVNVADEQNDTSE